MRWPVLVFWCVAVWAACSDEGGAPPRTQETSRPVKTEPYVFKLAATRKPVSVSGLDVTVKHVSGSTAEAYSIEALAILPGRTTSRPDDAVSLGRQDVLRPLRPQETVHVFTAAPPAAVWSAANELRLVVRAIPALPTRKDPGIVLDVVGVEPSFKSTTSR
jgi:hypothetical protein